MEAQVWKCKEECCIVLGSFLLKALFPVVWCGAAVLAAVLQFRAVVNTDIVKSKTSPRPGIAEINSRLSFKVVKIKSRSSPNKSKAESRLRLTLARPIDLMI